MSGRHVFPNQSRLTFDWSVYKLLPDPIPTVLGDAKDALLPCANKTTSENPRPAVGPSREVEIHPPLWSFSGVSCTASGCNFLASRFSLHKFSSNKLVLSEKKITTEFGRTDAWILNACS